MIKENELLQIGGDKSQDDLLGRESRGSRKNILNNLESVLRCLSAVNRSVNGMSVNTKDTEKSVSLLVLLKTLEAHTNVLSDVVSQILKLEDDLYEASDGEYLY